MVGGNVATAPACCRTLFNLEEVLATWVCVTPSLPPQPALDIA